MPAKRAYLTTPGQRTLKITAGILGGYFLAVAVHMLFGVILPDRIAVIVTGAFSVFLLWVALMIVAFLMRNGWVVWGTYALATLLCTAIVYLLK